ncbi:MAG: tetratricopeptide repeat protein [bacterium]|nr:tetratricopeptide repeat protein [bacterium]
MGILGISIILSIAVIIFIVARRLPDTRYVEQHPRYNKPFSSPFISKISDFFRGVLGKLPIIRSRNWRGADTKPESGELEKELKKPEDRDFWIESGGDPSSRLKPGLVVKAYFEEAEAAFQAKDYRKAEALFIEIAKDHPGDVKVFNRLGVIYLEQKNYEDAIEAFSTALRFDKTVASRFYNLALAHIGQGNCADAKKNLKEALLLTPGNEKYKKVLEQIEKKC